MSAFLTPLVTEQLGVDLFRLVKPLQYASDSFRLIADIPEGFITDLDSIPRWLPPIYAWLKGEARAPAVLHDWCYQTHRIVYADLIRKQADALLYEAMGVSGPGILPPTIIARWVVWAGVRMGGGSVWTSGPERLQKLGWDRRRLPRED